MADEDRSDSAEQGTEPYEPPTVTSLGSVAALTQLVSGSVTVQ